MKTITLLAQGLALACMTIPTFATESSDCLGNAYSEARSLKELPDPVQQLLKTDRRGLTELSDRGERFNAIDVGPGPRRRFSLAVVSPDIVLATVEHGGRAYFVEFWSFRLTDTGWLGKEGFFSGQPTESVNELVRVFCRGKD